MISDELAIGGDHFLDRKKSCLPIRWFELSGESELNPIYSWINAHRLLGSYLGWSADPLRNTG